MNETFTIKTCSTDSDYLHAVQLTKDYIVWLDMDLSFQDIDSELVTFPKMYGPPHGLFLLARIGDLIAGGVGFRRMDENRCEMKRLYVYDHAKNQGTGYRLCEELILRARNQGYQSMLLDTLERMTPAVNLYKKLGFKEISAYRFNPHPAAKYMELDLTAFTPKPKNRD